MKRTVREALDRLAAEAGDTRPATDERVVATDHGDVTIVHREGDLDHADEATVRLRSGAFILDFDDATVDLQEVR